MAQKTGRYRHVVSLQQPTYAVDGFGQRVKSWTEIAKIRCAMDPPSMITVRGASEKVLDGAMVGMNVMVFSTRPRSDVQPDWRLVYDAVPYDIISVRLNNERTELSMFAELGASNG